MNPVVIGLISSCCIFGGALLGMQLQKLLPSQHLSKEMQDLVKLSSGTIATLTALVLGLLVSSSKSAFDTINSGIVQGSAEVIFLDHTLARYGPEAQPVREQLKHTVETGLQKLWPNEKTAGAGLTGVNGIEHGNGMDLVQDKLSALTPKTEPQRQALAQAQQVTTTLTLARWLLIEQTHNQLPSALLVILVFWLTLLFVSFGLFAPKNTTAHVVLLVGAAAISAAIFLVLELDQPFEGLIKVSSAPMHNALLHLGQ